MESQGELPCRGWKQGNYRCEGSATNDQAVTNRCCDAEESQYPGPEWEAIRRGALPTCGVRQPGRSGVRLCTAAGVGHYRSQLQSTADGTAVTRAARTYAQWDPTGEQLALLPAGNTHVFIWSAVSKEVQKIDSEFKVRGEH